MTGPTRIGPKSNVPAGRAGTHAKPLENLHRSLRSAPHDTGADRGDGADSARGSDPTRTSLIAVAGGRRGIRAALAVVMLLAVVGCVRQVGAGPGRHPRNSAAVGGPARRDLLHRRRRAGAAAAGDHSGLAHHQHDHHRGQHAGRPFRRTSGSIGCARSGRRYTPTTPPTRSGWKGGASSGSLWASSSPSGASDSTPAAWAPRARSSRSPRTASGSATRPGSCSPR